MGVSTHAHPVLTAQRSSGHRGKCCLNLSSAHAQERPSPSPSLLGEGDPRPLAGGMGPGPWRDHSKGGGGGGQIPHLVPRPLLPVGPGFVIWVTTSCWASALPVSWGSVTGQKPKLRCSQACSRAPSHAERACGPRRVHPRAWLPAACAAPLTRRPHGLALAWCQRFLSGEVAPGRRVLRLSGRE